MKVRQTAQQVREQLERFSGIVFPGFSRPQCKFLKQMLFGIHASQDVKLSSIGRALGEEIALKKTEERLSHHLGLEGMAASLARTVPMMILTNVEVGPGRKSQWRIVQAYLSRWMVGETIRFIKQSYHLEDLRVLDYDRLRNLVALVLAVAYFTAVRMGESLKLSVLLTKATTMAKRFFGVPDFHYYARADGLSALLRSLGR